MALQTHKELKVWQESMDLVTEVYSLTSKFPKEETYALTTQIKKSVISIPSNISEGAARDSNKENLHFLFIAMGSLAELDTQLEIALNLNYIKKDEHFEISEKLNQIGKMLSGLIKFRRTKL